MTKAGYRSALSVRNSTSSSHCVAGKRAFTFFPSVPPPSGTSPEKVCFERIIRSALRATLSTGFTRPVSRTGRRPKALSRTGRAACRPSWPGRAAPSAWPTHTTTVQLLL